MADEYQIKKCIDSYLIKKGKSKIGAVEANTVLAKMGVLPDSKDRSGKPLRELLRKGQLPYSYKEGRNWVIPISSEITRSHEIYSISDTKKRQQRLDSKNGRIISFDKFCTIDSIKLNELNVYGFYCIRLAKGKILPFRYQKHLQSNRLIYIGKADKQTLRKRLYDQELNAIGHGTFFRSMGAVLNYRPPQGSLANKKNNKNYTFSEVDAKKIIRWMRDNLEVSWIAFDGDFSIESQIIKTNIPLLNLNHNPKKLSELEEDRALCRQIACS